MTRVISDVNNLAVRLSADSDIRPPINPITLSFKDDVLNTAYRYHHLDASVRIVRFSMILASVLYLAFALLDRFVVPLASENILWVRIAGSAYFFGIAMLTFTEIWHRCYNCVLTVSVLVGGGGVITIILLSESYGGNYYYAGLLLAIMFAHGLMRLPFVNATVTTWIVINAYLILTIISGKIPGNLIFNNAFFLVSANIMGMFASYGLDYYMKAEFWRTLREQEKSAELEIEFKRKSRELESARQIQIALLPASVPSFPGYKFGVHMQTATEIGGDYYDYGEGSDGTLTFAIGDSTGHGAQAGAMVTAMKLLFSEHAARTEPVMFLKRASKSLKLMGLRTLFMAAAIGRIRDDRVELAGAGMPPAILYRSATGKTELIPLKGMPLGGTGTYPYTAVHIQMEPGDTLLLSSDGLFECFNADRELLGIDRLEKHFASVADQTPGQIIDELKRLPVTWSGETIPEDDMTMMVIKKEGV
jgi:hypothetical protein